MSVVREVLLFSAAVGLVVGGLGVLIAVRERKNGSSWWAWVVPGGSGVLLLVVSLLKFVGAAGARGSLGACSRLWPAS